MKTENNRDLLKILTGLDERWIMEADPYREGAGSGQDIAEGSEAAGVAGTEWKDGAAGGARVFRMRVAAGVAAAALVAVACVALAKSGLPLFHKKPDGVNVPSPVSTVTGTPTPTMKPVQQTPTPTIHPGTPTPTLWPGQPTPIPTTPVPTDYPGGFGSFLVPRSKDALSEGEVMAKEYFRFLSPEMLTRYRFVHAQKGSDSYGDYNALFYTRDDENGRSFIVILVRAVDETPYYERRVVAAADVDAYDRTGAEVSNSAMPDEEYYTFGNAPIFRADEFTDDVMKRRTGYILQDGAQVPQMDAGIEFGGYVLQYILRGAIEGESASILVPAEGAEDPDYFPLSYKLPPYDDRRY